MRIRSATVYGPDLKSWPIMTKQSYKCEMAQDLCNGPRTSIGHAYAQCDIWPVDGLGDPETDDLLPHSSGVGLLSRFPPFRFFPNFSTSPKYMLAFEYHVHI